MFKYEILNDDYCEEGHSLDMITTYLLQTSTNILLNNYYKRKNDFQSQVKKRKINYILYL